MKRTLLFLMLCLALIQLKAQVIITGFHSNPIGANTGAPGAHLSTVNGSDVHLGGFEYLQFKATQDIDFSLTPYSVITSYNTTAAQTATPGYLTNGWVTGGARTYQFHLTQGIVQKGQFFYVGGPEKRINGSLSGVKSTDIGDGKGNPYSGFPETFESVRAGETDNRGVYSTPSFTVPLSTGNWVSSLSGVRNESSDRKLGTWAWRSGGRNTTQDIYLSMDFDVPNGASKVTVAYGIFGADLVPTWSLEYSTNQGGSWVQAGNTITEAVKEGSSVVNKARTVTFLLDVDGPVRFRIKKAQSTYVTADYATTSQQDRLNIDNFMIFDNLPKTQNVAKWIKTKNYYAEAGDGGVGNAKESFTILSPTGGMCGFAIFTGTNVTESSVPIDAVFMNNAVALSLANVWESPNGTTGLRVPNNDLYSNVGQTFMGQGTNDIGTVLDPHPDNTDDGKFCKLGGVYDLETNKWLVARSANYVALSQTSQLAEIETNDVTVLPVRLVSFIGKLQNSQIRLSWTTATEENNSHFNVLRSTDGKTFEKIGKINGNGTSKVRNNYQFIDSNPVAGTNYYKLEQVDFYGKNDFLKVIYVTTDLTKTQLSVVSSVDETLTVNVYAIKNQKATITLSAMSGQTVGLQAIDLQKGYNRIQLPVVLQKGIYVATLSTIEEKISEKFIR